MTMNQPNIEQIQRAVATSLREHWVLFLIEGIVLVLLMSPAPAPRMRQRGVW